MNRVFKALFYRYGKIYSPVMRLFLSLVHPLLPASGKDKTMKRIPKTPVEFDYDLWTTEDGKCMVRVKATGETTEVDREVMKTLRNEEKKLRRSYDTSSSSDSEDGEETHSSTVLSLDAVPEDDVKSSAWLADPLNNIEAAETELFIAEFRRSLSSNQREVFDVVLIGGMRVREYARLKGINHKSAVETVAAIRKKLKNIL